MAVDGLGNLLSELLDPPPFKDVIIIASVATGTPIHNSEIPIHNETIKAIC